MNTAKPIAHTPIGKPRAVAAWLGTDDYPRAAVWHGTRRLRRIGPGLYALYPQRFYRRHHPRSMRGK